METKYQQLIKLFIDNNYDEIFQFCDMSLKTNPDDDILLESRLFSSFFTSEFHLNYQIIHENFKKMEVDRSLLDDLMIDYPALENSLSFKLFYYSALSNSKNKNVARSASGAIDRLCHEYPQNFEPFFILGSIYMQMESVSENDGSKDFYHQEAIKSFSNVLKIKPGHIPMLVLLCSCHMKNDNVSAGRTINQGLQIHPNNSTLRYVKATNLMAGYERKEAREILIKLIEDYPESYEAKELAPKSIDVLKSQANTKIIIYKIIEICILALGIIILVYSFSSIFSESYKNGIPKYYNNIKAINTGGALTKFIFMVGAIISFGLCLIYYRIFKTREKSEMPLIFNLGLGLPCLFLSIILPFILFQGWASDLSVGNVKENYLIVFSVGAFGSLFCYFCAYFFMFEIRSKKK